MYTHFGNMRVCNCAHSERACVSEREWKLTCAPPAAPWSAPRWKDDDNKHYSTISIPYPSHFIIHKYILLLKINNDRNKTACWSVKIFKIQPEYTFIIITTQNPDQQHYCNGRFMGAVMCTNWRRFIFLSVCSDKHPPGTGMNIKKLPFLHWGRHSVMHGVILRL